MDRTKFKFCHFCGKELEVKETIFNPISGNEVPKVLACPDWERPYFTTIKEELMGKEDIISPHAIYTFNLEEIIKSNG